MPHSRRNRHKKSKNSQAVIDVFQYAELAVCSSSSFFNFPVFPQMVSDATSYATSFVSTAASVISAFSFFGQAEASDRFQENILKNNVNGAYVKIAFRELCVSDVCGGAEWFKGALNSLIRQTYSRASDVVNVPFEQVKTFLDQFNETVLVRIYQDLEKPDANIDSVASVFEKAVQDFNESEAAWAIFRNISLAVIAVGVLGGGV